MLRLRTHEVQHWHEVLAKSGVHVDLIIHPETELAESIMRVIRLPGVSDVHEFAGGAVHLVGMTLDAGNPVIGRTLERLSAEGPPADSLVVMIFRGPQVIIPRGSAVLGRGRPRLRADRAGRASRRASASWGCRRRSRSSGCSSSAAAS